MKKLQKLTGGAMIGITALSVILIIAALVIILIVIIIGGKDQISWKFFTQFPQDGMTKGGILPAIYGTALMVLIMSVAGVPFGTITAIYLTEYARENSFLSRTIRFAVKTLAMVPSIIFGLFGLGFFIKFVGNGIDQTFLGGTWK